MAGIPLRSQDPCFPKSEAQSSELQKQVGHISRGLVLYVKMARPHRWFPLYPSYEHDIPI